jgi:hypothetical protein
VDGAAPASWDSAGLATYYFAGSGPTIGGLNTLGFDVNFDLGEHPFTSTEDVSTLRLRSAIRALRISVTDGVLIEIGTLTTQVSGNISRARRCEGAKVRLIRRACDPFTGFFWKHHAGLTVVAI